MRAIVKETLIRPSWSGRKVLQKHFMTTQKKIISIVNDYIYERIHANNKIPVKCFEVEILTQHGKRVTTWKYSPTYR